MQNWMKRQSIKSRHSCSLKKSGSALTTREECLQFYGWMLIWYFLLTVSCLIDNAASNPFYQTWTIRVSRAPEMMEISERCPLLVTDSIEDEGAIIQNLRKGYNVDSRVVIPNARSHAKSRVCFYVVVSQTGNSRWPAALRIFSRGSNIASFAFGTTHSLCEFSTPVRELGSYHHHLYHGACRPGPRVVHVDRARDEQAQPGDPACRRPHASRSFKISQRYPEAEGLGLRDARPHRGRRSCHLSL